MAAKARLLRCGLSLAELAHVIERTEREIFGLQDGQNKEFRHNYPAARARVAAEVKTAWEQVKSLSAPIDILINDPTTDAALMHFQAQAVDGYDLFLLEATMRAGVAQVITDDGDYSAVSGIRVFTSNNAVVTAAAAQGKLLRR